MKLKSTRMYRYRGLVERIRGGRSPRYVWLAGYSADSEGGREQQPWRTKAECRSEAAVDGVRAVFEADEGG